MVHTPDNDLDRFFQKFEERKPEEQLTKEIQVHDIISNDNMQTVIEEEKQKLLLRNRAYKLVSVLIWIQLIFSNILVILIILSLSANIPFFKTMAGSTITLLVQFLKYYIGATIVELLGMLFFILRFLFNEKGPNV